MEELLPSPPPQPALNLQKSLRGTPPQASNPFGSLSGGIPERPKGQTTKRLRPILTGTELPLPNQQRRGNPRMGRAHQAGSPHRRRRARNALPQPHSPRKRPRTKLGPRPSRLQLPRTLRNRAPEIDHKRRHPDPQRRPTPSPRARLLRHRTRLLLRPLRRASRPKPKCELPDPPENPTISLHPSNLKPSKPSGRRSAPQRKPTEHPNRNHRRPRTRHLARLPPLPEIPPRRPAMEAPVGRPPPQKSRLLQERGGVLSAADTAPE